VANIEARPIPARFIPNAGALAIADQSSPSWAALHLPFTQFTLAGESRVHSTSGEKK
jgi:hypothetical protein